MFFFFFFNIVEVSIDKPVKCWFLEIYMFSENYEFKIFPRVLRILLGLYEDYLKIKYFFWL